jgi:hypothetical protein
MKKFLIISGVVIFIIGGYIVYRVLDSKQLSPKKTTTYSYNGLDLKVVYCSPSKRGRLIFGDSAAKALVPYGKYWRLGANEATEITLSKDVSISAKPLKAGSYRLYAVPKESTWEVSFNSELGKWGYDEPDHSQDVLKVEVPAEKVPSETEQFTITFSADSVGVNINFDWDKTHVRVPIVVK